MRGSVELERAQHLELALLAARGLELIGGLRGRAAHQRARVERLELHRIGAGTGRDVDEAASARGIAVMIDAGLRHDEHARAIADDAVADLTITAASAARKSRWMSWSCVSIASGHPHSRTWRLSSARSSLGWTFTTTFGFPACRTASRTVR